MEVALEQRRHSAAYMMARAIMYIFEDVQVDIGPATDDGFYYDFDLPHRISTEDFPKIEAEIARLRHRREGRGRAQGDDRARGGGEAPRPPRPRQAAEALRNQRHGRAGPRALAAARGCADGVQHGMFRVRGLTRDDAHIFCTPEQIVQEIKDTVEFAK